VERLAARLEIDSCYTLPISALAGDNVVDRSAGWAGSTGRR
jgi:sulfate adenylyltransferase subunit 1 (EFTu-like GTPase family)